MKILITGGCGFIGSNFVRYMLKKYPKYKIINLDKLTYAGNKENLKDIEKDENYKFVKGDICDGGLISKVSKRCDAIINFAAESIIGNTYLPIWTALGIKIYSFEELFKNISRRNKIRILDKGIEVIDLKNKNIKVLAYKGGIGYWMPVKQISRHRYKGKIIHLCQKWGEIEATPNHSIYDINFKIVSPKANPEILGLRNINHIGKKCRYKNYSGKRLKALVSILGAYVSEGWASFNKANGSYHIGVCNKDRQWITTLEKKFKLLGYSPSITKTKQNLYQLVVSNKQLFNFIRKEAGHTSGAKKIPNFIFDLEKFYQEVFLKYLIFADGETIENKNYKTIRYTTISKQLATGLSVLFTLLKHNFSIVKDKRFNAYTLSLIGDYTISLLNKNCDEFNYDGYVYDVSVEKLNNFVCGIGNIVVHNTHVDRSIKDASAFIKTNVHGTYCLLEAVGKNKPRVFIQISTDEVYGSILNGAFKETDPLRPNSPYAASKASADLLCRAYFVTYKTPIIITRSSNNFGPYQYPEKVIPLFITNALENKRLPLYADGSNVRDWLYVEDNCNAIDLVLHNGQPGAVYNIGGGTELSNIELTHLILKIMGRPLTLIKFVKDRPGHDKRYALSCEKIKQLGWRPGNSFENALKTTVKWYVENKKWWRGRR